MRQNNTTSGQEGAAKLLAWRTRSQPLLNRTNQAAVVGTKVGTKRARERVARPTGVEPVTPTFGG